MKKCLCTCFLSAVLLCMLLLSGCIFPLQYASPDPVPSALPGEEPLTSTSLIEASEQPVIASPDQTPAFSAAPEPQPIDNPKLAVFWYAMADAHVFDLREAFTPMLRNLGIPYREFDAENDHYRQLDQVKAAVADGYNIFAVNLVEDGSEEAARQIAAAAGEIPVLFFDRVPDAQDRTAEAMTSDGPVAVICTDPEETGQVQARMIADFLFSHGTEADLNRDGQLSYTLFLEDPQDSHALARSQACLETLSHLLSDAGLPTPVFFDSESALPYQSDPTAPWPSDAANALMRLNLSAWTQANGNMIELVIADSDEMALGALTALQSVWYNLGDGGLSVPLFGLGASVPARTAVDIGQLTGTVDLNAAGFARAVRAAVDGLVQGRTLSELFEAIAETDGEFTAMEDRALPTISVSPLPYPA